MLSRTLHSGRPLAGLAAAALAGLTLTSTAGAYAPGETVLTSGRTLPAGTIAGSGSGTSDGAEPSTTSTDGRYVAFISREDQLAPGTEPDVINVFRKDRTTGAVVLVSRATGAAGAGATLGSDNPKISSDGNKVAFTTAAQLVPADTDDQGDVYVRDIASGVTTLATPGISTYVYAFDFSGDGNYLAFMTNASLTPNDLNGNPDVYRRDLTAGTNSLASRISTGALTPADQPSYTPAISDDGRWVGFSTTATNVVAGFVAGSGSQVYVRDMGAGNANYLVSAKYNSGVTGGNGDSDRPVIAGTPAGAAQVHVAYGSDATNLADNAVSDTSSSDSAYLRKNIAIPAPSSYLLSRANGASGVNADSRAHIGGLSDDGTKAVFASDAENLGPGANYYGAYERDVSTDATTLLSAHNDYAVSPSIAGNGAYATWYESGGATPDSDPELGEVFGRSLPAGPIALVSRPQQPGQLVAAAPDVRGQGDGARTVSGDGRYVVFSASGGGLTATNGANQVFRRDLRTGALETVSRANGPAGAIADEQSDVPSIDKSGNLIAFRTYAKLDPADTDTSSDVYVRDVAAGTTTFVSRASGPAGADSNSSAYAGHISADGTRVAFISDATNLGAPGGDSHVYLRDLAAQTTTVVDRATGIAGAVGNADADEPALSADGRYVAFESSATNLDADDIEVFTADVYLRDTVANTTVLISRRAGPTGVKGAGDNDLPAISADGSVVAYRAEDELIAPEAGPWGGHRQIVSRQVSSGANTLVSRAPGGAAANAQATEPTLSGDASVVAFTTTATNLLAGRGGGYRDAVIARTMATGALSGPPAFGLANDTSQTRATHASLSDDGQCLSFQADGHIPGSGPEGDFQSTYLYVVSGACPKPEPVVITPPPAPALAKSSIGSVSITNKKFKVGSKQTAKTAAVATAASAKPKKKKKTPTGTTFGFHLNVTSTVTITIEQVTSGRKSGKKCVKATKKNAKKKKCTRYKKVGVLTRNNQAGGTRKVDFTGHIGSKKLVAGKYRATLNASNAAGASKPATLTFTVVKK